MLLNCDVGEDSWESLGPQKIQPVHHKGNQSWIFTGRTDAKAEAPNFSYLMQIANSLEKTLMLRKTEGRRRRGQQRTRWLMASPTRWTWVWASSSRWWKTGKPGVLQSTGSQRVGHDWATDQQQHCIYLLKIKLNGILTESDFEFQSHLMAYNKIKLMICFLSDIHPKKGNAWDVFTKKASHPSITFKCTTLVS